VLVKDSIRGPEFDATAYTERDRERERRGRRKNIIAR